MANDDVMLDICIYVDASPRIYAIVSCIGCNSRRWQSALEIAINIP